MRLALRLIGILVTVAVFLVAAVYLASESGEVLVLRTYDAAGAPHDTHVWVVDSGGATWIRAGRPGSAWYQRLTANPNVEATRAGKTTAMRAVPVDEPAALDRVHGLMAEKYGIADRIVALTHDGSRSVAVRLDPR